MLRRSFKALSPPPHIRGSALAVTAAVLATAGSFCLPPRAQALLVYTLRQTGPSTITITGGGTATLSGLRSQPPDTFNSAELNPGEGFLGTGPNSPTSVDDMIEYTGISGPISFGTVSNSFLGASTSPQVNAVSLWGSQGLIYFSKDFNGSQTISSETTFEGFTLQDLGLTPNTSFTWIWGAGQDQILRLDIEPVPGPLPALGGAAAFGWSRRLRRRVKESRGVGAAGSGR